MAKQIDKNKSALSGLHRRNSTGENIDPTSFLGFWAFISENIGNARLRININAISINEFIDSSGDPKDYLINLIKSSYKRSKCYHLKDSININCVLDILGETACELENQQQDDLYDIEFLEEIAFHISERYSHLIEIVTKQPTQRQSKASVSSLKIHKIRLSNSKL